jgi:hypothetical protein
MTEQERINQRIVSRRYWRRHKHTMPNRTQYFRDHYLKNRERKLAAANARNARLRELALCESPPSPSEN